MNRVLVVDNFKSVTSRRKMIDACVEQGFSIEKANEKLRENNFNEITEKNEIDWYETLRQNYSNISLRKKLIEKGKREGLSKFELNTILQKNNLRCLNEYESFDYTETLGRKNVINIDRMKSVLGQKNGLSREDIIQDGLKYKKTISEVNDLLKQDYYELLTEEEEEKYKKIFSSSIRSRDSIILDAIKNNLKPSELNRALKKNNLPVLSQFETLDFEQKKFIIQQQKRETLLKECTEERKYTDEINDLLRQYNFEELSEHEEKKIKQLYKTLPERNNYNQLSPQFQSLYKESIKKYHPDIYNSPDEKTIATIRMKEINDAKNKRDYFKLKSLIEKYEVEDENRKQANGEFSSGIYKRQSD